MIDARWLFLIVPVSMSIGALALIFAACIIAGEDIDKG